MSALDGEVPERIWWCFTCSGGVGVWGLDRDKPPPRCPDCRTSNFAPVKFTPEREQSEAKPLLRLRHPRDVGKEPLPRCESICDGNRCTLLAGHSGNHLALLPTGFDAQHAVYFDPGLGRVVEARKTD